MKRRNRIGWMVMAVCVPFVALVLAYTGIANQAFWDDEANTALFARNLNNTGTLTGWDGHNLVGFRYSAELNDQLINAYYPPLQYSVAALGMRLGGDTTAGGRWLFALVGVFAILVAMWWSRQLFNNIEVAVLTGLILSVLPSYLLYIRQCRYYSLGVLFSLTLWALLLANPDSFSKRITLYIGLVLVTTVLVFTHYLNALAAIAIAGSYLLLPRYRNKEMVARLTLVSAASMGCATYILLYANPFDFGGVPDDPVGGIERVATLIWWHLQGLGSFEFVPLLLLPLLGLPLVQKKSTIPRDWMSTGMLLLGMLMVGVLVTAVFTPQPISITRVADMRYLVLLIPIGAILAAVVIRMLYNVRPFIAVATLILLLGSNLFHGSYLASQKLGSTLARYIAEISRDYTSGTEAVIDAIKQLPDDRVVQVFPDFMIYPPMFYEPAKKYCCQLRITKQVEDSIKRELGAHLFVETAVPDNIFVPLPNLQELQSYLEHRYGKESYKVRMRVEHHWRDLTRPELPWHSFAPPSEMHDMEQGWVMLERSDLM